MIYRYGGICLIRNVNKLFKASKKEKQQPSKPQDVLQNNMDENIEKFRSIYDNCFDVVFRSFLLFEKKLAIIIYIDGLSDLEGIEEYVLTPLMKNQANQQQPIEELLYNKLAVSKIKKVQLFADCIESISSGNPILLIDGENYAFSLGLAKWEKRSIEEPEGESSIKGPREGFVESLGINTSLIRRIIKSPALKIQTMKIGTYTKTTVAITYVEGLVDKTLITEVKNRLNRINIDGILESEYIEELIEDNPFSPFPQFLSTERPDVVCANLLEGRVGILVEGTPFTIIAPITFFSLMQTQEDYYQRYMISTLIRWLRYTFAGISLFLPSVYVAITTFHQEMIPGTLLFSIAAARETVPFPALVEVFLMEITFEALREAGIRLPKQIGSAISIVGALVIGQAAVQAGLVSTPMVIVVAITGIASFLIPRYIAGIAIRMLRFPIILLGGTLGLLGIMLGIIAIAIHLCSLRSLGVPYLSPLAPIQKREVKSVLWRSPFWMMDTRPHFTGNYNKYRQSPNLKPGPNKGGDS
ncbi:spore germination protein [Bacillus sp. FJAT-49732]|uniref:Spore germination protein n=2 Tax=Lederbergia citrisecunda TaxID=2833583 RepID=A0A942TQX9_9BACI|nr:spore germination protein [Lederbergia citrisecunda]